MAENNLTKETNKNKKSKIQTLSFPWLTLSFVMLFNPNIQLIDLLPDFIGFFILAKFFERAADCAPYFEEARAAFVKLGFINLFKTPALIIVRLVRSGNTLDNDILALMTLLFSALELIYLIPAIRNIYSALSYLGERGGSDALIKSDTLISTDALRAFTMLFAIFKCLFYTLPEFLKLTRSVEIGNTTSMLTGSRYYPWAIVASLVLGFILGGIWLSRMLRFARLIRTEGKFFSSLEAMADKNSFAEYEKRISERSRNRIFLTFIFAAAASLDLTFSDFNSINLLPSFVFGLLFFFALFALALHSNQVKFKIPVIACGVIYNLLAVIENVYLYKFLNGYGYSALLYNADPEARALYKSVEIFAILEFLAYVSLMILFFMLMKNYTDSNLGRFNESSTESIKASYYKAIDKKTAILTIIGALVGGLSLLATFVNGRVDLIFTAPSDVTMPTIIAPIIPGFSLWVAVSVIAYTFYSVYYFNFIKDEMSV